MAPKVPSFTRPARRTTVVALLAALVVVVIADAGVVTARSLGSGGSDHKNRPSAPVTSSRPPPTTNLPPRPVTRLSLWLESISPGAGSLARDITTLESGVRAGPAATDYTTLGNNAQLITNDVSTLTQAGAPPDASLAPQWARILGDLRTGSATVIQGSTKRNSPIVAQGRMQILTAAKEFSAFAGTSGLGT